MHFLRTGRKYTRLLKMLMSGCFLFLSLVFKYSTMSVNPFFIIRESFHFLETKFKNEEQRLSPLPKVTQPVSCRLNSNNLTTNPKLPPRLPGTSHDPIPCAHFPPGPTYRGVCWSQSFPFPTGQEPPPLC